MSLFPSVEARPKPRWYDALPGSAVLSNDGRHRLLLTRSWDAALPIFGAILLNPSDADATVPDPTLGRVCGFARDLNFGGVRIGNLWSLRSPYPTALLADPAPLDPRNDVRIARDILAECAQVVVGWGAYRGRPDFAARKSAIRSLAAQYGRELYCWGRTKDGEPRHPLYLPAATPLERWP